MKQKTRRLYTKIIQQIKKNKSQLPTISLSTDLRDSVFGWKINEYWLQLDRIKGLENLKF